MTSPNRWLLTLSVTALATLAAGVAAVVALEPAHSDKAGPPSGVPRERVASRHHPHAHAALEASVVSDFSALDVPPRSGDALPDGAGVGLVTRTPDGSFSPAPVAVDDARRTIDSGVSVWLLPAVVDGRAYLCVVATVGSDVGSTCNTDAVARSKGIVMTLTGGAGRPADEVTTVGALPDGARDVTLVRGDGTRVALALARNTFAIDERRGPSSVDWTADDGFARTVKVPFVASESR